MKSAGRSGCLFCIFMWSRKIRGNCLLSDFLNGLDRASTSRRRWVGAGFGGNFVFDVRGDRRRDGLRLRRIWDPCLVTDGLDGLDYASSASSMVGSAAAMWGRRRDDLDGRDAVDIGAIGRSLLAGGMSDGSIDRRSLDHGGVNEQPLLHSPLFEHFDNNSDNLSQKH
ncbi:hypothetical protein ACLOJK_003709 [Asimina triloba]